eukprot:5279185-Pleurochrysis_carterae.AAC.1
MRGSRQLWARSCVCQDVGRLRRERMRASACVRGGVLLVDARRRVSARACVPKRICLRKGVSPCVQECAGIGCTQVEACEQERGRMCVQQMRVLGTDVTTYIRASTYVCGNDCEQSCARACQRICSGESAQSRTWKSVRARRSAQAEAWVRASSDPVGASKRVRARACERMRWRPCVQRDLQRQRRESV